MCVIEKKIVSEFICWHNFIQLEFCANFSFHFSFASRNWIAVRLPNWGQTITVLFNSSQWWYHVGLECLQKITMKIRVRNSNANSHFSTDEIQFFSLKSEKWTRNSFSIENSLNYVLYIPNALTRLTKTVIPRILLFQL